MDANTFASNVADSKRLKVVFLSQYFYPEETATAEILSGIAFRMAKEGVRVEAITGQPSYRAKGKLPRVLVEKGVRIHRVPATQLNRRRIAGRILNTITFCFSAFLSLWSVSRDAILLCVTNPPTMPWLVALVSWLRRIPFILIVHDVYPDVAVELGHTRADSLPARLWRKLNCFTFRRARFIVTVGHCMQDRISECLCPAEQSKVVVIPNWADGDAIRPLSRQKNPFYEEADLDGEFVVQYSGNMGVVHDLQTVVAGAKRLRSEPVRFLFIGDGAQRPYIEEQIFDFPQGKMLLLPFQPKGKLPHTLTACDVGLVTLKSNMAGVSVPSKLYGILAAGKPVIGILPEKSEIAMVIRKHGCGVVVQPGDVDGFLREIDRLRKSPVLLRKMGRSARSAFEENYTLDKVAGQYLDIVNVATNGHV